MSAPLVSGSAALVMQSLNKNFEGKEGMFIVYNDASYSNIKEILDPSIGKINSTTFGVNQFKLPDKKHLQTSWFGGHLSPDDRTTTTFTIENPTSQPLEINIKALTFDLIKKTEVNQATEVHLQDPMVVTKYR